MHIPGRGWEVGTGVFAGVAFGDRRRCARTAIPKGHFGDLNLPFRTRAAFTVVGFKACSVRNQHFALCDKSESL
jgi:hypothetical protein